MVRAIAMGAAGVAMNYILQCTTISRPLSSSALDGGAVFLFLMLSSMFLTSGIGHLAGADLALIALLSLSAVAATCAACANNSRPDPRGQGVGGVRAAVMQGARAAAAGALFALPLCYAYSIVSRSPIGATPSLAQIGIALVPLSVFFSQVLQGCVRPYGRTQRRIVIIGDLAAKNRIAGLREIAREIVGFFELGGEDPLAGGGPPSPGCATAPMRYSLRRPPVSAPSDWMSRPAGSSSRNS